MQEPDFEEAVMLIRPSWGGKKKKKTTPFHVSNSFLCAYLQGGFSELLGISVRSPFRSKVTAGITSFGRTNFNHLKIRA